MLQSFSTAQNKYQKCRVGIQEAETYFSIELDFTRKVEGELEKLLAYVLKLVQPDSKHIYYRLLYHIGSAMVIYGLSKVHKPDVPLRPIVVFTRSPLHRLTCISSRN